MGMTLIDKIWNAHFVARRADGYDLIYIDRHVLHELHAPHAFARLDQTRRTVRRTDLTIAVQDHTVITRPSAERRSSAFADATRAGSQRNNIRLLDIGDRDQGIVHVVSPELGIAIPGATLACPDSHACTVGGLGVLAFGCGTSELEHVLASQVLAIKKPKQMRITLDGTLPPGVTAKDVILHLIGTVGVSGGRGYFVEYAGEVVRAMTVEARLTLCNMTIEFGARTGIIAPDRKTFDWCEGRPWAPKGEQWRAAVEWCRSLATDSDARFDREVHIDCSSLAPQLTWGTDPGQVAAVSGVVPDPELAEPERQQAIRRAIDYMGLKPGQPIAGLPVHRVFIGSCTNARLSDLQSAAEVVRGRRVADGVVAFVVPGSSAVKRQAEAAGLDRVFADAGFEWHESGCSMCAGTNGDLGKPGERCISTSNRNFENRQGPGVRTHLASPAMAAAAAIAGCIVDVREFAAGST